MTLVARPRNRLFTYLEGSGHTVEEVGGKGAGLDRLVAAGLPVPTAAVLTTDAYRLATEERSLHLLIEDLRTSSLPAPDGLAAEGAAIERTFLAAPLPETITTAIARIGREMLPDGPVAVRSSATTEDTTSASFAGQYLTITGVSGLRELERAIRRCWASLWAPAARAYRRHQTIDEQHVAMAVVIQTMVDPIWSGVAFTSDPERGRHLIRVEAVAGPGEALVSGRVTPDDYTIRKDTLQIVPGNGAEPLDFLEDLSRLAIDIERMAHAPQDIEWAYTLTGLTLLQTRPITAAADISTYTDRLATTAHPQAVYTPHGIIEMLPGVLSPLLWTINAPMLEDALRTTLACLGGETPDRSRRLVCRFRGRAALDLSALGDIAASLPGGSAAEVERQYLGRPLSAEVVPGKSGIHMPAAFRMRGVHNRIADEVALVAAAARGLNAIGLDLEALPVRRLVAYRRRIRDLAWRGYAAEVGASSAAATAYHALELLLARWYPKDEAARWAQRTTSGKSAVGAARAKALADVLSEHATNTIRDVITGDAEDRRERIAATGPDGSRFLTALDTVVNSMGSQALYGDITWAENEWWIWRQLQLLVAARDPGHHRDADEIALLCRELASRPGWRRTRILTGQFVDVRIRLLRRQVAETARLLELREKAKDALLVLGGEERRAILEAANRMVDSRLLARPEEVHFLTDAELEAMLFGGQGADKDALSDRRRVAARQARDRALPDWFRGDPDDQEPIAVVPGNRISGWAASPGRAEGTVRIVDSLAAGTRLQHGDVLVAHATDPSWTPLLLTAGAIVLETGGPLAHVAIVAREFGLPAVLNVPSATSILTEGETVRVDGSRGVVDRIGDGSSA